MVARLRAELAERVNITAENSKALVSLVSLVADDVRRIVGLPTQLLPVAGYLELSSGVLSYVPSPRDLDL